MNSRKIALFLKRKQHVVANAIALQLRYRWRRTLPSSDTATNRKRRNPPVADYHIAYDAVNLEAVTVGCLNQQRRLAQQNQVVVTPLDDLTKCVLLSSQYVASRQNTHNTAWGDVASLLEKTVSTGYLSLRHGGNCVKPRFVPPHHRVNASVTANSLSQAQAAVGVIRHSGSLNGVGCAASTFQGVAHQMCWGLSYGKSVPAPCEWYPIVLPNNPDSTSKRCRKHQVGNRVPIRLNKRHIEDSGRNVPLDLTCRRKARGRVPLLETYMILNKITAKCGEIALNPLSASARADMGGYCWMCELTLSPDDFFKLGLEQTQLGQEKIIQIQINGDVFVFMAENISDNRRFAQRNYTVSGRSLTAKLGADYALGRQGVIEQDLYASQIAQQQVADLGFTLEWQTVDWLIPSNTYTQTDKSPIAVIMDLAQACGAFVYSHPSEPKLFVLPKWREAAWNVNAASPDLSVPSNIILQISGQKNVQTQCHGVFVFGSGANAKAAHVMRAGTDGLPETSVLSHAVYTDLTVCEAAGIAALSETGTHKSETITLPVAKKYGLGIAQMGQIWRFNEPNGAWHAVIQGVSVSVSVENDVPVVKQTVSADRYLGS